jgi:endonuclease V-like protein UPF0215 family
MAPKTASLTLIERIEQELSGLQAELSSLQARGAELSSALKVVREFSVGEVPEPVKSRLTQTKGAADKAKGAADKTNGGDLG